MHTISIFYLLCAFLFCIISAGQSMQEEVQITNSDSIAYEKRNVCPCGRKWVAGISCLMRRNLIEQPKRLVKRGDTKGACQCLPCPKSTKRDPLGMPHVVKTGSAYEKALEACMMKNTMTTLKDPKAETTRCSEVVKDPGKKR